LWISRAEDASSCTVLLAPVSWPQIGRDINRARDAVAILPRLIRSLSCHWLRFCSQHAYTAVIIRQICSGRAVSLGITAIGACLSCRHHALCRTVLAACSAELRQRDAVFATKLFSVLCICRTPVGFNSPGQCRNVANYGRRRATKILSEEQRLRFFGAFSRTDSVRAARL
jgi:hypothetical protein